MNLWQAAVWRMQGWDLPGVIDCHHQTLAEVLKDLRLVSCIDHATSTPITQVQKEDVGATWEGTVDLLQFFGSCTAGDRSAEAW